jgi:predicted nucleic acid-binding protein
VAQVIDASVAVAWCVQTQATRLSEAAIEAVTENGGHVPSQFWFEVLHGLSRSERRGLVRREIVDRYLVLLSELPIIIDEAYEAAGMVELNELARQHAVKIYDASYLELALRLRVPLATRDASLARAAQTAGVTLFTA